MKNNDIKNIIYNKSIIRKIRIIGGKYKGYKLPVLHRNGLRPTPSRVRETLFNWLTPIIQDANCLDCFAGTGALGLEALSRYANSATFLEIDYVIAQQLKKLLQNYFNNGIIINTNAITWLKKPGKPFDMVFVDPPFRNNLLEQTLYFLEQNNWLSDKAFLYVESEIKNITHFIPSKWSLYREKKAGQVKYRLYQR